MKRTIISTPSISQNIFKNHSETSPKTAIIKEITSPNLYFITVILMLVDSHYSRWNEDSLKKSMRGLQQEQEVHIQEVYKMQH